MSKVVYNMLKKEDDWNTKFILYIYIYMYIVLS